MDNQPGIAHGFIFLSPQNFTKTVSNSENLNTPHKLTGKYNALIISESVHFNFIAMIRTYISLKKFAYQRLNNNFIFSTANKKFNSVQRRFINIIGVNFKVNNKFNLAFIRPLLDTDLKKLVDTYIYQKRRNTSPTEFTKKPHQIA